MQWNSASDFFAMGGYGYFVWMSFGVTATALVLEVLVLRVQRKRSLKRLGNQLRMAAKQQESKA